MNQGGSLKQGLSAFHPKLIRPWAVLSPVIKGHVAFVGCQLGDQIPPFLAVSSQISIRLMWGSRTSVSVVFPKTENPHE